MKRRSFFKGAAAGIASLFFKLPASPENVVVPMQVIDGVVSGKIDTNLAAIDAFIDTEISAIMTNTDSILSDHARHP